MDETRLVELLQSHCDAGSRLDCPEDVEVAGYVDARIGEADREVLERHLSDCRDCRDRVGFLVRAVEVEPATEVPATLIDRARGLATDGPPAAAPWWGVAPAAAAAVVALVAVALWLWPFGLSDETGSERSARAAPTAPREMRGAPLGGTAPKMLAPQDGAVVDGEALEVRWEAAPSALFYEVQLADADGDLLWTGRVDGTSLRLSDTVTLESGVDHYVWVRAWLSDGRTLRSSIVRFGVGAPQSE